MGVGPPRVQDRREPEHERRAERAHGRERDGAAIERDLAGPRRRARDQRGDTVDRPHRDQDPQPTAAQPEDQTLGDELADQPAPARAERVAHRDLAGPGLRAREQEVGDVDDRDQQDEQHRALQQPQGRRERSDQIGVERTRLGADDHRRQAPGRDQLVQQVGPRPGLRDELGAERRERRARGEPRDDAEAEARAEVLGEVEVGWRPDLRTLREAEAARHHADHGDRPRVEVELLADELRVAAEPALPDLVAEDDDLWIAGLILLVVEPAAERGAHAEQRRQRAGRVGYLDADRPIATGERRRALSPGRDRRARLAAPLQILEASQRHAEVRQAQLAGDLAVHTHQLLGLRVRQRPQDDGVDDAEDRRGGADAEGERDDEDRGQPRRLAHHAERVADVQPER
jgi:hypothetical protein